MAEGYDLEYRICERLTASELIDLLGVSVEEVYERFEPECSKFNWDEVFD